MFMKNITRVEKARIVRLALCTAAAVAVSIEAVERVRLNSTRPAKDVNFDVDVRGVDGRTISILEHVPAEILHISNERVSFTHEYINSHPANPNKISVGF